MRKCAFLMHIGEDSQWQSLYWFGCQLLFSCFIHSYQ